MSWSASSSISPRQWASRRRSRRGWMGSGEGTAMMKQIIQHLEETKGQKIKLFDGKTVVDVPVDSIRKIKYIAEDGQAYYLLRQHIEGGERFEEVSKDVWDSLDE